MADSAAFHEKLKFYLRSAGFSQKNLAEVLGLQHQVLSRKLSDKGPASLTRLEIKHIVVTLLNWKALTTFSQTLDLLETLGLGEELFSREEWRTAPLNVLQRPPDYLPAVSSSPPPRPARGTGSNGPRFNNLPAPRTSFIGRESEVELCTHYLQQRSTRLLTIVGPGGSGKTRLAMEVARRLQTDFGREVCFAALAAVTDPTQVASTIAQALGMVITKEFQLIENLTTFLNEHKLVLVLDNFEQVIGAAGTVDALLAGVPDLQVIVTSREVLQIYGEQELRIPPLEKLDLENLPSGPKLTRYDVIRLFVERARLVMPDFEVNDHNGLEIAQICNELDGLPLAIELAAAQIKMLSPSILLKKLARHRLDISTAPSLQRPARHQTLRNTLNWSYELLEPAEQQLFCRTGLFRGGFTLDAALAVGQSEPGPNRDQPLFQEDMLDRLTALVDKSLLVPVPARSAAPAFDAASENLTYQPGFSLLETVREFAFEQLDKQGDLRAAMSSHLDYYSRLARVASSKIEGPDQVAWLALLEVEQANLRAALENCFELAGADAVDGPISGPQEFILKGLELAVHLFVFWDIRTLYGEGRTTFTRLLKAARQYLLTDHPAYTEALARAGVLAGRQGDYDEATGLLEQSFLYFKRVDLWNEAAFCRNYHGIFDLLQGNYQFSRQKHLESLALTRRSGETLAYYYSVLMALGVLETALQNYPQANAYLLESLPVFRQRGQLRILAACLNNLGLVAALQKDYRLGIAYYQEGYELQLKLGDRRGMAYSCRDLGFIAFLMENPQLALNYYRESLRLSRRIGDRLQTGENLALLAAALFHPYLYTNAGSREPADRANLQLLRLGEAAALVGASEAQLNGVSSAINPAYLPVYTARVEQVREKLGPEVFAVLYRQGQTLDLEKVEAFLVAGNFGDPAVSFLTDLSFISPAKMIY